MPRPEPDLAFFEGRPPNAPFSALLRHDPFRRTFRIRDAAWRAALVRMPLTNNDRLLDVGSGNGLIADRMHALFGIRPVSVDLAMRGLREAAKHGVAVRPVCADALALPFADASFAGVLSFETLEHIPEWALAVHELVRVTRPGGHIIISAVSSRWKGTWDWWLDRLGVDVLSRADHDPTRFIDERKLQATLERAGTDVLQVRRLNAFATLAYDEVIMAVALVVDRVPAPAGRLFLAAASALVRVVGPALTFTELPWLAFGRSNSILVIAKRR